MRKFVVLALLICMMMSFVSCNPDPATGNPGPTSRVATESDGDLIAAVLFSDWSVLADLWDSKESDPEVYADVVISGTFDDAGTTYTDDHNYSFSVQDLVLEDGLVPPSEPDFAFLNGLNINGTCSRSRSEDEIDLTMDVSFSCDALGSHSVKFTASGYLYYDGLFSPVFSDVVIDGIPVTGLREAYIRSAFGDVSRSVEVYKWDGVYEDPGYFSYHHDFWLFHDTESDQYEIYVNERNDDYSIYDLNRENKVGPFVVDYNLTILSNTVPLGRYLYVSDSGDSYAVTVESSYLGHSLYDSDYVAVEFTEGVVFVIEGQLYYYNWRDEDLSLIPHIGTGLIETNADAYYENDNTGSGPFYLSCPELKCTYKDGVNDVVVFFDDPSGGGPIV